MAGSGAGFLFEGNELTIRAEVRQRRAIAWGDGPGKATIGAAWTLETISPDVVGSIASDKSWRVLSINQKPATEQTAAELGSGTCELKLRNEDIFTVEIQRVFGKPIGLGCTRTEQGLIVSSVLDTGLQSEGVSAGDIIIAANGKHVTSKQTLTEAIGEDPAKLSLLLKRCANRGESKEQRKSASQLERGASWEECMNVRLEHEEEELLGITLDKELRIQQVQSGSLAEGRLQVGDVIVAVNTRKVSSQQEFWNRVRRSQPSLELTLRRRQKSQKKTGTRKRRGRTTDKRIVISLEHEEGEQLGMAVNETLMVSKIQKGSVAEGKIQLGDIIRSLNGKRVQSESDLFQMAQKAQPSLQLTVHRNNERTKELASKVIPGRLEKLLNRRPGFEYRLVQIDYSKSPEKRLGLTLGDFLKKVIVTNIKEGSVSEEMLKVNDRLVLINGNTVNKKDIAKKLILKCGGDFQTVIERPISKEAVEEVERKGRRRWKYEPFVAPKDVQEIAEAELRRRKCGQVAPQGMLTKSNEKWSSRSVSIDNDYREVLIPSDIDPRKILKKVPRRGEALR